MKILFVLLFSYNTYALVCSPSEIYVREQQISAYKKTDGTSVKAHIRKAHCRKIQELNYFKDTTRQKIKGIETTLKKWKPEEKKVLEEYLEKLPSWLKKYKLSEILRGDVGGGPKNPASAIPLTKSLLIFDNFFIRSNKLEILIHEVAHIAILDLNEGELLNFSKFSGWVIDRKKGIRLPPKKLILPDSSSSPSEDFANHVEIYYSDPKKLKKLNPKMFSFIESIIKKREH